MSEAPADRTLPEIAWNARKAAQERRTRREPPPRYVYIGEDLYWLASHAAEQMEACIAAILPAAAVVPGEITPADVAWAEQAISDLEAI